MTYIICTYSAAGDLLSKWMSPDNTTIEWLNIYMRNAWDLEGVVKVVAWQARSDEEMTDENVVSTQLTRP